MKTTQILLFALIGSATAWAQTNTFPATGNVGIGTTSPSSKLHIYDPPGGAAMAIERGGKLWNFSIQHTGNNLFINNSSNPSHSFTFTNTGRMGIGTTSPNALLDLNKTVSFNYSLLKLNYPWDKKDLFQINRGSSKMITIGNGGGSNPHGTMELFIKDDVMSKIRLSASPLIDSYFMGRNVGIGTTSPDMKLTVKGNIHAEEVKIDLSVPAPDYVFKEDYDLASIDEVEKFIKKNHHLPEIPSAKEFEKNGVMQAEMDMSLLKKIEELTLYLIQQNKEITELRKQHKMEITELRKKVEVLEAR